MKKTLNLLILISSCIIMFIGLGSLYYGEPEGEWSLGYLARHINALGFSIVGAIGFFTELLYFNIKSLKNN